MTFFSSTLWFTSIIIIIIIIENSLKHGNVKKIAHLEAVLLLWPSILNCMHKVL